MRFTAYDCRALTRGRRGPWTGEVLTLIARQPGAGPAELTRRLGRERLPCTADARRLKEYGLTESLEVG